MLKEIFPVLHVPSVPIDEITIKRIDELVKSFSTLYIACGNHTWVWFQNKWPQVKKYNHSIFTANNMYIWLLTTNDYLSTPNLITDHIREQLTENDIIKLSAPPSYDGWPFTAGYMMTALKVKNYFENIDCDAALTIEANKNVYLNTHGIMTLQEQLLNSSPVPYYIQVEAASSCNLSCKMCMYHSKQHAGEPLYVSGGAFLPAELFDKIIEEISGYYNKHPMITPWILTSVRGEYFLHPKALEWIKRIRKNKIGMAIITNGMLVNEMTAQILVEHEVNQVTFSLDSATYDTGQSIRVGYDQAVVESNIERVVALKQKYNSSLPFVSLSFTDIGSNSHEIEDYLNRWKNVSDQIIIQSEQYFDKELWARRFVRKPIDISDSERDICFALLNSIVILADGSIHACACGDFGKDTLLGHISQDKLADCFHSYKKKQIVNAHRNRDFKSCSICEHCETWKCYQSWRVDKGEQWKSSQLSTAGLTLQPRRDI